MSLRVIKIATRLRADQAYTLIEFLDEMRCALMHSYGWEIREMLQAASTQETGSAQEDEPF
jgi:hypothetical protein